MEDTEVKFNMVCDSTKTGDVVGIVGNVAQLGLWDIYNAKILETTPQEFPNWSISLKVPRNIQIEYKYVLIRDGLKVFSAKQIP